MQRRKSPKMQHEQHTPLPLVEGVDIVESEEDLQLKKVQKTRFQAKNSQNQTLSNRATGYHDVISDVINCCCNLF